MNGFIILKLIVMILCCYTQCCVGYNEPCDVSNSNPCTTSNEVCSSSDASGTCVCDTGYVYVSSSSSCQQERDLGETCTATSQCSNTNNALCTSSGGTLMCLCESGYYGTGTGSSGTCTKRSLGQTCSASSQCLAVNAECSSGTCQCQSGYNDTLQGIGGTCERRDLGESCSASNQCEDNNAECSSGSICQCMSGYFDTQTGTGGSCLKRNLGQTCSADNQCSNTDNAQCSSSGGTLRCQCQSGYYGTGTGSSGTCTKRILGQSCTDTSQCSATNSECRSGTCQCVSGYYDTQSGNGGTCEKRDLGESCSHTNQCNGDNVECTGICSCVSTHFRDGNTCTLKKKLGESGCLTSVTSCKDTQALCYSEGSIYKCRCNSNYYDTTGSADEGGACTPKVQLGYDCQMPDGCISYNSQCLGELCKCMDNYYDDNTETQLSGNCQPRRALDGYCSPSSSLPINLEQCFDNAICTYYNGAYRCSCKSNTHPEDNACVQNIANGETCTGTSSNECSDENAQCISGKCTCGTNYYDDNNLPVGGTCRYIGDLKVSGLTFPSIDVTTTSLKVTWTAPSTISFISNYKVSWSPNDNNQSPQTVNKQSTFTTISGLYSGRKYTVVIKSVNTGTQSGVERSTMVWKDQATKPNQPGPLNTNDVNYSTDADGNSIYLVWTASSNSEVTTYNIKVLDSTEQKYNKDTSNSQPRSQIYFSSIKQGYTYRIEIIAKSRTFGSSNNRESSSTFSTTIKTTVKAPGRPTNVQCGDTTDSFISLSWTAPGLPNGQLVQYMIKVYTVTTSQTFSHTVVTGNTNQEYTVPSLNPGSYYRFEVFTVNELYNSTSGQFSPNPYCATKAHSFREPQNFSISGINSRGFTSTWSEPANIGSGEMFGYVIQIKDGEICVLEQIYKCTDCTGSFDFSSLTNQCGNVQTMTDKSKSQLNEAQAFTAAGLNPDIVYTVTVSAINSEGKGYMAEQIAKTLEEAPQKPFNVAIGSITSTTLTVQWSINGPRPGVTTYTIIVVPVDTAATTVNSTVQGFTNTFYNATGLEEFWTYTVTVKVATSIGEKTSDASSTFQTLAAAPGPVDAFAIEPPDGDYTKLKVSWKTPTVLEKNGVIKEFKFTHNATELQDSTVDLRNPETFEVIALDSTVYEKIVVVQPEDIYMFKVYAVNEDNQQGYVTSKIKMAPAGVPKNDFEDVENKKVIPINKVVILGQTSFRMVIKRPYLEQTTYGAIVLSGIIICTDCTSLTGKDSISLDAFKTYPNYNDATDNGGPYRPVKDSWVTDQASIIGRRKTTTDDEIEYTVGEDVCTNTVDFCNGPLKPDTPYSVQVVVCTNGGCLLSNLYGPFKTEAETSTAEISSTIIIISVMGAVILVLVVAFVISFVHHRIVTGKPNGSHSNDHTSKVHGNATFENLQPDTSPSSENDVNNYMELDEACRHSNTYDRINNDRKTLRRERGRHMRHERI